MHICTSGCGKDFDCPVCEHGYHELDESRQCPTCSLTPREKSIGEMEIVKNWYNKHWVSYQEYLRLANLIF